jgi:competence protein ComEC
MTPLLRPGLAWIIGIALARWLNLPWPAAALAALPSAGAAWLYWRQPRARHAAIFLLAVCAGAFRLQFFQPVFDDSRVAFYNNSPGPVTLTGVVVTEPDTRDTYTNLRLRVNTLESGGAAYAVDGLVLVRAPRYPARFYGDRLRVTGRLETPPEFEDFSYKEYLARTGIYSVMRRPRLELVESGQGAPVWAVMYALKTRAAHTINRLLAEPHASLLNGILLGLQSGIPRDLYEDFNRTGTSHIIVISGSNISLVAAIFLLLATKTVGRRFAPVIALGGIIGYTLLVGADAAVSRAAVMGSIWVLSIWVGRPGVALNSLLASGIGLTLLNPLILWDVGFQLSFMATLGLIVLVPPLQRLWFDLLRRRLPAGQVGPVMALLNDLVIITLAAQIITTPLIVYHFGRLSLVSLLTNLLILPAQPPIMILGGLAALGGMLWLPLGQIMAWLVYLPLAWSVWVVEITARLPLASIDLGRWPLWLTGLAYAALAAGVWWANRPAPEADNTPAFRLPELGAAGTRLWLGGAGAVVLLVWLAVGALPDGRLRVAFLDVGQGDAVLVTLPDGRQLLIDGGPAATDLNWRLGQHMPFWDRTLEMVVNTHPDADHLAGLVSLFDRFRLEQAVVSDVGARSALYREWESALDQAGIAPMVGQAGMRLDLGSGVWAEVLNPGPAAYHTDEPNNHSVALRLAYGQVSFLLPGDIETPVEQALVRGGAALAATVLKSGHHGSKTSSSEAFLAAVDPQVVVISVGADNGFGHPSPEVLGRYAALGLPVLRTDERGTIEFITDGQRLWVETDH